MEIVFKSVFDPYARADVYVAATNKDGEIHFELEEAYLTTLSLQYESVFSRRETDEDDISIGLAIVLAVRAGGVIPVFSFIVVPPVAAILMTQSKSGIVLLSLAVAVLGAFFGIYFSVQFDFPAGSSIVAMLGVLFAVASLGRLVRVVRA